MFRIAAVLSVLMLLGCGCATYEVDLVQPPEVAGHVGSSADKVVRLDPLVYRLRSYANRLVMRIENPTDDPITLIGVRSTVVDPSGQSHPLLTATIAPASFIKVVFPPVRPRVERLGPSVGIGAGFGYGRYDDPVYEPPRAYAMVDDSGLYWDWEGESDIRVALIFDRKGRPFQQSFTFHRRKI